MSGAEASMPFPLGRWLTPEVQGFGRTAITAARPPRGGLVEDGTDAPSASDDSPWVQSLDGTWAFRLVASPAHVESTLITGDDGDWDRVAVPGTWVLQGHGSPIHLNIRMPFALHPPAVPADNPTGVYRRQFRVPRTWARRRTFLRIGSADSMAWVWVNERFVGMGKDSRLASTFEIGHLLRPGANSVCIVVPRWSDATWLEDQDQWWLPGLHRRVELVSEPLVRIADAALVPGLAADGRTGLLDVDVEVDFGPRPPTAVAAEVVVHGDRRVIARSGPLWVPLYPFGDPQGEAIAAYTWPGHRVHARLEVAGVDPWTHETPTLYRATVTLRDSAGAVLDVRSLRVGFRRIEVAGNQLLINGVAVVINGVNRHETHPDRGRTLSIDDMRRDLVLMKQHHINAIRTSHYPDAEELYDLCDELGLYVVDEANIETHARWRALADDPRFSGAFLERAMRMVRRDRSHPCVIAWSLGNESGYGANHEAMAAWIRRTDPSRPLHYEGGFSSNLDADAPASDIVCPMYTSAERIEQWSDESADRRRPLILCEYSHAMGQAGGLDGYWRLFGQKPGLQGGFVWEWCDHGLRRHEPDGTEWLGYGGDFGEPEHDGSFVCDGLVSPDREPHPLLTELAALTQPVAISWNGRDALRIENRRWFTDLGDLRATWVLEVSGRVVGRGALAVPAVPPQRSVVVPVPFVAPAGPDAAFTVAFHSRRASSWARRGWCAAVCQLNVPVPRTGMSAGPASARPVARRADIGDGGIVVGDDLIGFPSLSLWRPPTDNDDPPGAWRPRPSAASRWRDWGLDRLATDDVAEQHRRGGLVRTVRYAGGGGAIVHEQRLRTTGGRVVLDERVDVAPGYRDLPRIGVAFSLPAGYDDLEWFGMGPGDSYPDRRAAARFGRWSCLVGEQRLPFVVPQEFGLHLDTRWFTLRSASSAIIVTPARPLAFSALRHTATDLTQARHAHELPARDTTEVHLDVAHRGLGTAACGPDTAERWKIGPGAYRWRWELAAT